MIGHGGLLRAFSFARLIKGFLACRGSTPRHAQTAGDLSFAVQFTATKLDQILKSTSVNVTNCRVGDPFYKNSHQLMAGHLSRCLFPSISRNNEKTMTPPLPQRQFFF